MEHIVVGIILLFMSMGTETSIPDVAINTPDTRPLYTVIDYTEPYLTAPENWHIFSGYEQNDYASVGWLDCCSEGVISVATLRFDTGIYDTVFFDNIMAHYSPYTLEETCSAEDLVLYEHHVTHNTGTPYLSRYWVDTSNPAQVMRIHMLFAEDKVALLEKYAERFFPSLPVCEPED